MVTAIHRNTWLSVDLGAALHNIKVIKKWTKAKKVYAVLKADAYGLGAVRLAESFEKNKAADAFVVANVDEALELRNAGSMLPIWVLGAWDYADIQLFVDKGFVITIPSLDWLKNIPDFNGKLKVSLAIDTGMTRIGFDKHDQISEAKKLIDGDLNLELFSVYTHFATADEAGEKSADYFAKQLDTWHALIDDQGFDPEVFSMANSATCIWRNEDPRISFAAIRPGEIISGNDPSNGQLPMPKDLDIRKVISLHTKIADVRYVAKGQPISYGATEVMPYDGYLATVPIGYEDGLLRRMQDGPVIVEGKRLSMIGRITMDQTMILLDKKYPIDTEVTIIGKNGDQEITVADAAEYSHTIVNEIQTAISPRVKRIYK